MLAKRRIILYIEENNNSGNADISDLTGIHPFYIMHTVFIPGIVVLLLCIYKYGRERAQVCKKRLLTVDFSSLEGLYFFISIC